MITIGVDFHKRTSSYCIMSINGQKIKQCKLENTSQNIRKLLESIEGPKQLAMEATRNWGLFHDEVKDLIDVYQLGHPKKMKAITESETKNDKKDAEIIAQLMQSGFLPKAHVSSLDTRQLRSLLRFRHFLVTQRKSIRNQVQILIDRNMWPADRPKAFKDVFCQKGRAWLNSLKLAEREQFILKQCLDQFDQLSSKIEAITDFIQTQSVELTGLKYLRTVPGFKVSRVNALIVLLEIDTIKRFARARSLAHYAGLVPKENSSADKHRMGRLVKSANMFLRTAFLESSFAAMRSDKGLRLYYQSVKQRRGSGAGVVAVSRKLAKAVYHVLKEQRAYRPEHTPPAANLVACAA